MKTLSSISGGFVSSSLAIIFLAVFLPCLIVGMACHASQKEMIALQGTWRFQLDPENKGIESKWFEQRLSDSVNLPGSLNENGIGNEVTTETPWTGTLNSRMWHEEERFAPYREPDNTKILFWLQPDKHYIGAAWYQQDIEIPESFSGKSILVFLERCHWETQLWIDGVSYGGCNSLSIPHAYDLGPITPGRHTLTLRVDNTYSIDVGLNAHSVSDNTQTNWNGVIGEMKIIARDSVFIDRIQTYPDIRAKQVRVKATLRNTSGGDVSGTLTLTASMENTNLPVLSSPVKIGTGITSHDFTYPLGESIRLWNEFDPAVYTMESSLDISNGAKIYHDVLVTSFGMRELGVEDTQFTLNGERIFLRGTLECCIFPKTGYPPTDVASWLKILQSAKAHGLNHLRFHSWCPPEAAFIAGDQMGFLFQIEGPFWTNPGLGDPLDSYIIEECNRILDTYGNHPSFGFFAYGNEPGGKNHKECLAGLLQSWKKKDSRHLYTSASGWPIIEENQYHVTFQPRIHSNYGGKEMRFGAEPFSSISDYSDFVKQYKVPVVSHEIGQWCVFPNLKEIDKYTGPLKPRNFEIVRDLLAEQGMLDQAENFLMASGKLQTICYKEEIEAALRTPGFGGFQLLDLHDFPGQGTALVGMLDPFWESKGYVTSDEFNRFCGPVVPLVRMERCVFTRDEPFHARAEVTHFGPAPLLDVKPLWRVKDSSGNILLEGSLEKRDIPRGSAFALGDIVFDFSSISAPAQLLLELAVGEYANDWDLWVYPEIQNHALPPNIHVAHMLDTDAIQALEQGGKVLLLPAKGSLSTPRFGSVPSAFPPIFWNTFWFPGQKLRTLGLLCDPLHPLFAAFPTEFHSNWQWWDLVANARVMSLDGLPLEHRPLVQVIDDWNTCRKLGLVFETSVGSGKLLVCSVEIENNLEERPAASQFRASLLNYMASDAFAPKKQATIDALQTVFQEPSIWSKLGAVVIADSEESGCEARNAIDGNPNTFWHTGWSDIVDPYPHWIRIDLQDSIMVHGLALTPRQDMNNGHPGTYRIYVGNDTSRIGRPLARGTLPEGMQETAIPFEEPKSGKHILLEIVRPLYEGHPWASVAEIRLLTD